MSLVEYVRPNVLKMPYEQALEFFQAYWKRRGLDLLKPAEWEVKKKPKKGKKPAVKKKKAIKEIRESDLPPEILALLKKNMGA